MESVPQFLPMEFPPPLPRGGRGARLLVRPSGHCEHPLGENEGVQGGKCKWQSVKRQRWITKEKGMASVV